MASSSSFLPLKRRVCLPDPVRGHQSDKSSWTGSLGGGGALGGGAFKLHYFYLLILFFLHSFCLFYFSPWFSFVFTSLSHFNFILLVLDSLMKNCSSDLHSEVLSSEFMNVLKGVITSSKVGAPS